MTINVDMVDIKSGQTVWISGQHVYVESGVYLASGAYVIADVQVDVSSGLHVQISGQHVYVESGVWLASGQQMLVGYYAPAQGPTVPTRLLTDISGQAYVWISGQHVYVESGVYVASGIYHASGVGVVVQSGTFAKAIIIDTTGNEAEIDATVHVITTIDTAHHEIHAGNMWHTFSQTSGLADGANLDVLLVAGSGQEVHAWFENATEGAGWFELWEGVGLSGIGGSGIPIATHCMNRYISGIATTTCYKNPNFAGGTRIDVQYLPGGEGPKTVGGGGRGANEWILNGVSGPVNYVSRVINVAGAAKDAQNCVEFYEARPGY